MSDSTRPLGDVMVEHISPWARFTGKQGPNVQTTAHVTEVSTVEASCGSHHSDAYM